MGTEENPSQEKFYFILKTLSDAIKTIKYLILHTISSVLNKFMQWLMWSDFIIYPAILFLTINALFRFMGEPEEPFIAKNESVLNQIDSLSKYSSNPLAQRIWLVNVLQERMSLDGISISSVEETKMQLRLFYAAILAGVASILFTKGKKESKTVGIVLLFLIVPMYLLEVHRNDLYQRQVTVYATKGIAVDFLVNLPPQDTTWYVLTNDNVNAAYNLAGETRFRRKILTSLQPDPEQILFYLLPMWGIYVLSIRRNLKTRKSKLNT